MEVGAVLLGLALGVSLAAPPGPMNALIAREASRHGPATAIRVGMGAPVADYVFLVLLVIGAQTFLDRPGVIRFAAGFGAMIMGSFGWGTLFGGTDEAEPQAATFWAGFITAMTNPYQIAWWLSGGFVFLQAQGWWGIGGLTIGIFGWVVAFAWLVAHGAQRWSWFTPLIRYASAGLLLVFAVLLVGVALAVVQV